MSASTPFLSRLFAFFIIISFLYGALYTSRLTTDLARKRGLEAFHIAVSNGDLEEANTALELAGSSSRPLDLIPLPPFEPHPAAEWDRILPRVTQKLEALRDLNQKKHSSNAINQLVFAFPAAERKAFSETLQKLNESYRKVSTLNRLLQQTRREEELTWTKIRFFTVDFRNLLNLQEDLEPEDSIDLYTEGYLEGLPKVKEINSEISTSLHLRLALQEIGLPLPKVKPKEFEKSLKKIRTSASEAIKALDESAEQAEQTTQSILGEENTIRNLLNTARAFILSAIRRDIAQLK